VPVEVTAERAELVIEIVLSGDERLQTRVGASADPVRAGSAPYGRRADALSGRFASIWRPGDRSPPLDRGLAALVRERFDLDPLSGHLFLFLNRRGDRLKILAWDHGGFRCSTSVGAPSPCSWQCSSNARFFLRC
jgi:hypothetical protein